MSLINIILRNIVLDACVLFPWTLRDPLLRAAEVGIYELHITEQILEETKRNLLEKGHMTELQGASLIGQIRKYFQDSFVTRYEHLIAHMPINEKDRHVLAAAVASHSQAIVTQNLKDFPQQVLEALGIKALSADDFLVYLLSQHKEVMIDIVKKQASESRKPPMTVEDLLEKKLKKLAPNFAQLVQQELANQESERNNPC